MLSNGPGDPAYYKSIHIVIARLCELDIPIFGICLGHQLLAIANGMETIKLPFGHRGMNQPVIDTKTKKAYLTSQNHGYAVDQKSITHDWGVWFRNLNDGTVEGLRHHSKDISSVQFHPEANPGPKDTEFLFDNFTERVKKYKGLGVKKVLIIGSGPIVV
jgi:carbamoyl-phosphate synthase small subunit